LYLQLLLMIILLLLGMANPPLTILIAIVAVYKSV
jgi:hypothetical protein